MNTIETGEVEIAPIHDVDSPGLDDNLVEDIHIVDTARRDDDHRRDIAAKVQKGVKFHCAFPFPELRPRKQRQTEIDRG